jgi:hypothetical protein
LYRRRRIRRRKRRRRGRIHIVKLLIGNFL